MCFLWWCDCLPASYPDVVSLESANRWSNRSTVPVKLSMGQGGILEASWDCSNPNCLKEIFVFMTCSDKTGAHLDEGLKHNLCSVVAHASIDGDKWSHFAPCTVFTLLTVRLAVFDPSVVEQNWQLTYYNSESNLFWFWNLDFDRGGIRGPFGVKFYSPTFESSDNHNFVRIFT